MYSLYSSAELKKFEVIKDDTTKSQAEKNEALNKIIGTDPIGDAAAAALSKHHPTKTGGAAAIANATAATTPQANTPPKGSI